jgi:ubiquinone/menaquinone biosynthesis C-methylase UbiE
MTQLLDLKSSVRDFWEAESCGEVYGSGQTEREFYESNSRTRYLLEPYIHLFAAFASGRGADVLEVGVGLGSDHAQWALSRPRSLTGIDLTHRAIEHTRRRLSLDGLESDLRQSDAENLPFPDASFDVVYSWGVLHHSPDTPQAIKEVHRVLRPGGTARLMIYHKHSLAGYMLWSRYALMRGRPFATLEEIYAKYLESPGTKAYTVDQAREMLAGFSVVTIQTRLSFGELLEGAAGQRHTGWLLDLARRIWPKPLIRMLFRNRGLLMLITATK